MQIGTPAHRELFCRSFMESHVTYHPSRLPWPVLEGETLELIRSIPFWEEALHTERQAGLMVSAFAEEVSDPLIREAIALQGVEETRHGQLIQYLINYYQIPVNLRPQPQLPPNLTPAFIRFGYTECFDSFFALGLFELARQSGLFPASLFRIFEPVIHEEVRHIVFFVNWVNYLQIHQGRPWKPLRDLYALSNYGQALHTLWRSLTSTTVTNDDTFTSNGAKLFKVDLTPELLLRTCLRENHRRLGQFDPELLRPEFLPQLSGFACRILLRIPGRRPATAS